jgi:F0F1-type ATP synthase assembly protein I
MSIIVWILLGLVLGLILRKIVSTTGEGTVVDILLGIVGAVLSSQMNPGKRRETEPTAAGGPRVRSRLSPAKRRANHWFLIGASLEAG